MISLRTRARVVGSLFLMAAVTAIIGLFLYDPVLHHADYALQNDAQQARIATGAFMEVLLALSMIGIGVGMYPVLRKLSETLALGYAFFRLLESTIVIVGMLALLTAVTLSNNLPTSAHLQPEAHLLTTRMLVALHDWTFLLGPNTALGVSTSMMSFLLFRHGLVPRWISALGLVGGPMIFVSSILVMYGLYAQQSAWGAVAALPVFLYEMSVAVYLIARGFRGKPDQPSAVQSHLQPS